MKNKFSKQGNYTIISAAGEEIKRITPENLAKIIQCILEQALELLNQGLNTVEIIMEKEQIKYDEELVKRTVDEHSENIVDAFTFGDEEAEKEIIRHMVCEVVALKLIPTVFKADYEKMLSNKIETKLAKHSLARILEVMLMNQAMEEDIQ
jgi:hypothetical protein